MVDDYLMKTDKANMANSVEERLPLLDKNLAQFRFHPARALKLRGGTEKYILRQAFKGRLPQAILERKKMGFLPPAAEWMRGEIGEEAMEKVAGSELIRPMHGPGKPPQVGGPGGGP